VGGFSVGNFPVKQAGVAEQTAEDVGEEIGQLGGFLESICAAGDDEAGAQC
jgi:hypothetical protein